MGATGGGGVCEMGVVGRGGGGGVDVRAGGGRKGNMAGWLAGWLMLQCYRVSITVTRCSTSRYLAIRQNKGREILQGKKAT